MLFRGEEKVVDMVGRGGRLSVWQVVATET